MDNGNAEIIDLTAFSNRGYEVYAVCDNHIDIYPESQIHGIIETEGQWQCDNCPEDFEPATGPTYVVSE